MKNAVLFMSMLFCAFTVFSQAESDSKFKFGFNIGTNYANLQSKEALPANSEISNGLGFNLGLLMDYSITDKFTISPKAELAFYNSSVDFVGSDNAKDSYDVFPYSMNFMTHFAYKIGNNDNALPYIFVGPNLRIPVANKPDSSSDFTTGYDVAIDFGIGLEKVLKHFIFAPELKYSYGMLDVNQNPVLQTLNFHSVALVLNLK